MDAIFVVLRTGCLLEPTACNEDLLLLDDASTLPGIRLKEPGYELVDKSMAGIRADLPEHLQHHSGDPP